MTTVQSDVVSETIRRPEFILTIGYMLFRPPFPLHENKGCNEQNQECPFIGNLSPEFTWEDVVEGRTIMADGSRTE